MRRVAKAAKRAASATCAARAGPKEPDLQETNHEEGSLKKPALKEPAQKKCPDQGRGRMTSVEETKTDAGEPVAPALLALRRPMSVRVFLKRGELPCRQPG
jgi:hypothetical protein